MNPVELLEPLHVPTPETPVLREEEVAAVHTESRRVPLSPQRPNGGLSRGV